MTKHSAYPVTDSDKKMNYCVAVLKSISAREIMDLKTNKLLEICRRGLDMTA